MPYAKYIGQGKFFSGVPTRDLNKAEWDALEKDIQTALIAQGVFAIAAAKETKKKVEE